MCIRDSPWLKSSAFFSISVGTFIVAAAFDALEILELSSESPLTVPSTAYCKAAVSTPIVLTTSSSSSFLPSKNP